MEISNHHGGNQCTPVIRHINKDDSKEDSYVYLSDDNGHDLSDAPVCSEDRQA